jgi:magnesium transporter
MLSGSPTHPSRKGYAVARPRDRKKTPSSRAQERDVFVEVRRPDRLARILHKLILARAERRIEAVLARLHPADIAQILTFLPVPETAALIRPLFRLRKGAATLIELPSGYQAELLDDLDPELTGELLRRLPTDDAVDLLQAMDDDKRAQVLQVLNIEEVAELQRMLAFGDESAGSIMNPDIFAIEEGLTINEAISRIREAGRQLDTVFYVYVVDTFGHLVGTVSMRDLLLAEGERPLSEIVDHTVVVVKADMEQTEVAEIIAKYDLLAVPVVGEDRKLLGVITVDDVIDVIQEAATEELYRMVALDEDDRVFSAPGRSVLLRLPWLTLNFMTALLAAYTVGLFEDLIAEVVVLAALMPIVAGMGGNAGAQTLTVVIRGIALGELSAVNARRAVTKELTVGLINGLVIGLLGGLIAWIWKGHWWLGLVLGVSMVLNLCVAALGGATIPLILRRLKLDPALGSSIFLTTLTDVFGFFSFLGLASWLLPRLGVAG